jgi:hypothetical protein
VKHKRIKMTFQMRPLFKFISVLVTVSLMLPNQSLAGENNWVSFIIRNNCSQPIYLEDAVLEFGKWYKTGVKSFEYSSVNQVIPPAGSVRINACGRMLSPTGTNGQFALLTKPKNTEMSEEIAFFAFEIFFSVEENVLQVPYVHDNYKIKLSSYQKHGPDMGFIYIMISKLS